MALDKPKRNRELPQMSEIQGLIETKQKLQEAMEKTQQLGDDAIRQQVETDVQKKQQETQKRLQEIRQQLTQALQGWGPEEQKLSETGEQGADVNNEKADIQHEKEEIRKKLTTLQQGLPEEPTVHFNETSESLFDIPVSAELSQAPTALEEVIILPGEYPEDKKGTPPTHSVISAMFDTELQVSDRASFRDVARQKLQNEEDILWAYEVFQLSNLTIAKFHEIASINDALARGEDPEYDYGDTFRKIKGALGEYHLRENSIGQHGAWFEHESLYLKPERDLEEIHRWDLCLKQVNGKIIQKQPDGLVFSTAGNDKGRISYVVDAKAWSETTFNSDWAYSHLKERAEEYAALQNLSPRCKIVFALPDDVIPMAQDFEDRTSTWDTRGYTVEFIPMGITNAELNQQAREVIGVIKSINLKRD